MPKTIYNWNVEFSALKIATFPVHYRNKQPKIKWEIYQNQLPDELQLKKWFLGGSLHNYGVVAGWNDLVVLDFDDINRFYKWHMWTIDNPSEIASIIGSLAMKVRTNRGMHVYLSIPNMGPNSHIDGLDIKTHGYVLGPGSTHPSGKIYETQSPSIIIPRAPSLQDILPADWYEDLKKPAEEKIQGIFEHKTISSDPFDSASNPLVQDRDLITQVKQKHKIQDFIKGVIKTGANWYMGICPFHEDHDPSLWIDDAHQICNCQKCAFPKPLDVINLFARIYNMTDAQALLSLVHGG